MKNIIIISASARKGGNSDVLCDEFARGAAEVGQNAEKINICDYNLAGCIGCYACRKTKRCFRKDGMNELLQKLIDSDVIVMATPTYFYTMNSQMKAFIDRCLPRYTEISGKEFYFIITAAETEESNLHRVAEEFKGFTDCLNEPKIKGVLYATGVWEKGDVKTSPHLQIAYEMGKHA